MSISMHCCQFIVFHFHALDILLDLYRMTCTLRTNIKKCTKCVIPRASNDQYFRKCQNQNK